jgi:hypothetical protein
MIFLVQQEEYALSPYLRASFKKLCVRVYEFSIFESARGLASYFPSTRVISSGVKPYRR